MRLNLTKYVELTSMFFTFMTFLVTSCISFPSALAQSTEPPQPSTNCQSPSHDHLRDSDWSTTPDVEQSLDSTSSSIQSLDHDLPIKYDEYTVTVTNMPPGLSPEQYLEEMQSDLNQAVNNQDFDFYNEFTRRVTVPPHSPAIGDIYDIDIVGPDNGSVMLVEQSPSDFVFQTIQTPFLETGTHPESGAREFGFEQNPDGSTTFYTRGASQSAIQADPGLGDYLQGKSWLAMMKGISDEMNHRGGQSNPSSITSCKATGPFPGTPEPQPLPTPPEPTPTPSPAPDSCGPCPPGSACLLCP